MKTIYSKFISRQLQPNLHVGWKKRISGCGVFKSSKKIAQTVRLRGPIKFDHFNQSIFTVKFLNFNLT